VADYIPQPDGAFDVWVTQFLAALTATPANYGLVAGDLTAAATAKTAWDTKYGALPAAEAAFRTAVEDKEAAREALVEAVRPLAAQAQANPGTTDPARETAGLPVYDTTPTAAAPPATPPLVNVIVERLRHTLHFVDSATPLKRAKPAGVRGCQIWLKVGDPAPTSASQLTYVATDGRTPYVLDFDGADAGKVAHYWAR
jgi:hypothetical protein